MAAGVHRWEDTDHVQSIDAQIAILRTARDEVRAEIPKAEELAVRAIALDDPAALDNACAVVAELRRASHDFTIEIDELQTERRQLLPMQRVPAGSS